MRAITVTIPGDQVDVTVKVSEAASGGLTFNLSQGSDDGAIADLRGLFFDLGPSVDLKTLEVEGTSVGATAFKQNEVSAVGSKSNNMNGVQDAPYDVGVEIGTPGIGKDDIKSTQFTLASTNGGLSVDALATQDVGVRLMSVGPSDSRGDSSKNTSQFPDEPDPGLRLDKTVVDTATGDNAILDQPGETITYELTVTNTGSKTLTNARVVDPLTGTDQDIGDLSPGETQSLTASYTITQADLDNNGGGDGDIDNTATATSDQTGTTTASAEVPLGDPATGLALTKTADRRSVDEMGQTITYTFTLTNTGTQALTGLAIQDDAFTPNTPGDDFSPAFIGGDTDGDDALDVDEIWTYQTSYTVREADLQRDSLVNVATATSNQTGDVSDTARVAVTSEGDVGSGDGNDTIQGLGGDDRIFGNGDRGEVSFGINGRSVITVGDNLFGNQGADTFVYQAGDGVDLIWDFKSGAGDQIVFEGLDATQVVAKPFDLNDGYTRKGLFVDTDGGGRYDDGAIVFKDPARIDSSFFAEHVTFSDNITPPPPTPGGMTGTAGPDTFASPGAQADSYAGLGGADKIFGNEGKDHLDGGAGNDEVQSTQGGSTLIGGTGDDLIEASGADDLVWGGASAGGDGDTPAQDSPDDDGPENDTPDEGDTGNGSGLAATVTESWEGGYIADFTVRAGDFAEKGFSAFRAEIDAGTTGEVVSGWSSDLGAPLAFTRDGADGVFDNLGGWQRPIGPDETFTLSFEVAGGTPDDDTLDLAPVRNRASVDEADVNVDLVPFGNGQYLLTGTIENTGEEAITDWGLALDFDAPFNVETVWGGTVTEEAQVHVEAESWNGTIAPGDSADFGLVGTAEPETDFTGATFV